MGPHGDGGQADKFRHLFVRAPKVDNDVHATLEVNVAEQPEHFSQMGSRAALLHKLDQQSHRIIALFGWQGQERAVESVK